MDIELIKSILYEQVYSPHSNDIITLEVEVMNINGNDIVEVYFNTRSYDYIRYFDKIKLILVMLGVVHYNIRVNYYVLKHSPPFI